MMGINPISHHHLSSSSGDRPILDNLSTSSTSTNNDSFLGAVSSNPTSRLLLAGGGGSGPGGGGGSGKGRKKKDSGNRHLQANIASGSSKLLLSSKSGQPRDQMQAIFSPQTASYHCECLRHPLPSSSFSLFSFPDFFSPFFLFFTLLSHPCQVMKSF